VRPSSTRPSSILDWTRAFGLDVRLRFSCGRALNVILDSTSEFYPEAYPRDATLTPHCEQKGRLFSLRYRDMGRVKITIVVFHNEDFPLMAERTGTARLRSAVSRGSQVGTGV
jgi:hypothetical protein